MNDMQIYPYDYCSNRKQIWACTSCKEERVYGDGSPEGDGKALLICQNEGVLRLHIYIRMSITWVGKRSSMGPGWAIANGENTKNSKAIQ